MWRLALRRCRTSIGLWYKYFGYNRICIKTTSTIRITYCCKWKILHFFIIYKQNILNTSLYRLMCQLWQFVTRKNMTYRIYQIDKALFNFSFLLLILLFFFFFFFVMGRQKFSYTIVFFPFKYIMYIERYVRRVEKNGKKERCIKRRKKDALNRICLIKSIVILINSTENCHRYCHDLRFLLLWDWDSGSTFFWHFYMRFSHIVSVTYWDCVFFPQLFASSHIFKTQCLPLHSTIFSTLSPLSHSLFLSNIRVLCYICV